MRKIFFTTLSLVIALLSCSIASAFVIDHQCTDINRIPDTWLQAAKNNLRIGYSHTSHGSQLISGINALRNSNEEKYSFTISSRDTESGVFINDYWANSGASDLGHNGDLRWVTATENMLKDPDNDRNVVMWSWCGGVSDNTAAGIDAYLNAMHQLEMRYPQVTFIYMTGHLDGSGSTGNLHRMNERIRNYCRTNNKILFDFADIESYDPDGTINYMQLLANDGCDYQSNGHSHNWARDWINGHPTSTLAQETKNCGGCAHSQCLNCVLKGRGFWWMMARIAGWNPESPTPPVTPTSKLYYPHIASGDGTWHTEICALNPDNTQTISGVFKAFNNKGKSVSNQINLSLVPHARQVINIANQFINPETISYIILECNSEKITGFIKFYIKDVCRVAIPAVTHQNSDNVPITHIASDQNWWSGLSLVNTTLSSKQLTLFFNNGVEKKITLAAGEHRAFSIKSLFDNQPQTSITSALIAGMSGVVGLELFGNGKQLSGILLSDNFASELYFPHIVDDLQWWTGIVAYNPQINESTLTISPFSKTGSPFPVFTAPIAPFSRYVGTVNSLALPPKTAWLKIKGTDKLSGFELFGSKDGQRLGGYSSVGISGANGILANLEKDGWSGIAFVNIETSPVTIQLKAYNNSGELIATESIDLQIYEKKVVIADALFSTDISAATYITYSANHKIVAFQLNNSSNNTMLDALPTLLAPAPGKTATELLAAAQTWMYQIQGLDQDGAVATLAATDYPLFVLEPGHNFSDYPYDTATIVNSLKKTPNGQPRLLLAYIDIGQAEDYRDYWGANWVAPTASKVGSPDFLITIDPDGWSGNYPVAYWRPEWKNLWLGDTGIIATLARYGFDGVYLDWVEAYDDDKVIQAAIRDGVDPQAEMIKFVEAIRVAGRAVSPDFLVIAQNAPYLIDFAPDRYRAAIDGLAVEDTWFHGEGDAEWNDPAAGDLPNLDEDEWSTAGRLHQYEKYLDYGLPVFSVDYCISNKNAAQVYQDAKKSGLRSLVTRVSLSRLTETPPEAIPELKTRADGARQLTFATGTLSYQNPCFSPDGSFIVFTGFENGYNLGPAHIYRLDLNTESQPVKLTCGDYDDVNVPYGCFERSTGRVIFASDREDDNDFWSINPVAGKNKLRRLTSHGELPVWIEPVFSPSKNIVAFESGPQCQGEEQQRSAIYIIDLTTAKVTQMTNFVGTMDDRLPSWSPDGSQLLYQHRNPAITDSLEMWEAWIVPAAGGLGVNLSATISKDQPGGPDTDLSWLANGRYVLSSAPHGGIEHPSIFMLPVAGGRMIRLTNDIEHEDGAPSSSSDSKYVCFESHRTTDENSPSDIWIINNPL